MSSIDPNADSQAASRAKIVAGYVGVGIVATLILLALKVGVENLPVGRDNELWVFGKLQSVLPDQDAENPIVLIDISDLRGGTPDDPTSRDALFKVVQALVTLKDRPRAVGIDVDFSPKPNEYSSDADYDFLQNCLDLTRNHQMPVFLAVGQRKGAPPEAWLGDEEFESLASAVAIDPDDTRRMPLWVRPKDSKVALNTLSYSLALAYRKALPGAPSWIAHVVESRVEDLTDDKPNERVDNENETLVYADRLVNYSKLDAMKDAAKKDITPESVRNTGDAYKSKIVIIGDVSKPKDFFPIPGRKKNEGGTLILASATYTLIKEPLFEFKPSVSLLLDILIAALIIAMVAVIRYRNPDSDSWTSKQALFIYGAVLIVLAAGVLFVRIAGVMWLDFLLVISALAFHPKVERLIHWILKQRSKRALTASKSTLTVIFIAALILESPSRTKAQQANDQCQNRVAAVAAELGERGRCYYRERGAKDKKAISKSDLNKKQFYAGQQLSCEKDCALVIWLCGNQEKFPVPNKYPNWYRVLHAYASPIWVDPKKGVPARSSKNFVPDYPAIPFAQGEKAAASGMVFGRMSGNIIGAITGIAARPKSSPNPSATPEVPSPEEEQERIKAIEQAKRDNAFIELIEKANRAVGDKKYPDARQFYQAAAEIKPNDWRTIYGIGNTYLYEEKWDEAEAAYRKALVLNDNSREVLSALAYVLLQPRAVPSTERVQDAEPYVWRSLQVSRGSEPSLDLLDLLLDRSNASASIREQAYRKAVGLYPGSININLRLSNLLRANGQDMEADRYLTQAENHAYISMLAVPVAQVLMSLHRYDEAKLLLERTHVRFLTDIESLVLLARMYVITGKYKEAVDVLTEADQYGAKSERFLIAYVRAVAELSLNNLAVAEESLDTAASGTAGYLDNSLALADVYASIGDSYAASGKRTNAIRLYEKALRLDPEDKATETRLLQLRQHQTSKR